MRVSFTFLALIAAAFSRYTSAMEATLIVKDEYVLQVDNESQKDAAVVAEKEASEAKIAEVVEEEVAAYIEGGRRLDSVHRKLFEAVVSIIDETEVEIDCATNGFPDGIGTCYEIKTSFSVTINTDGSGGVTTVPGSGTLPVTLPSDVTDAITNGIDTDGCKDLVSTVGYKCYSKTVTTVEQVIIVADEDPHFKTWGQEWYDYMGQCDLVMVDAPSFNDNQGLLVQLRTKARYEYSYIESAAIKIGDDVFEIGAHGFYMLNGISNSELPATVGGFPLTFKKKSKNVSVFTIDMGQHGTAHLKAFKDLCGVQFEGTSRSDFGDSVGMMGDYGKGRHLARDGESVIEDNNDFGQEWQVLPTEPMLFQVPSTDLKCVLPSPKTDSSRRLGETISEEDAKTACANSVAFEQCVYDVIATGDLENAFAGVF